jgi:hypothetical protein
LELAAQDALERRIREHFGAIGRDDAVAIRIYADDAVLEYVQSNERIRGIAGIVASRREFPGPPSAFDVHRVFGTPELQAVEMTMRIEGDKSHPVIALLDLRDGFVIRERIYVAEPWDPPAYRADWVEPIDPEAGGGDQGG